MLRPLAKFVGLVVLGSLPLLGQVAPSAAPKKAARKHRGTKPPAPVQQQPVAIAPMTPEQLPAQPPRVSYQNGRLTVDSQNSTLSDILTAIRRQTGAQIDPAPGGATQRVAAHLTGTPQSVLTTLLEGSNLGYIIMAAPDNPGAVQRVVLTTTQAMPSAGPQQVAGGNGAMPPAAQPGQPPFGGAPEMTPDDEDTGPDVVNDRNPPQPPDQGPPPQQEPAQQGFHPGLVNQPNQNAQPQQQGQNPFEGGEQPRFGPPGQPPQQIPPQQTQPPDQNQQPDQPQIKTPDQLLQELQRLRQQQQQQQQQQQNPPQQP